MRVSSNNRQRFPRGAAARPKMSGKTAFFPQNDRPYGVERAAFQTEIALKKDSACLAFANAPHEAIAQAGEGR